MYEDICLLLHNTSLILSQLIGLLLYSDHMIEKSRSKMAISYDAGCFAISPEIRAYIRVRLYKHVLYVSKTWRKYGIHEVCRENFM